MTSRRALAPVSSFFALGLCASWVYANANVPLPGPSEARRPRGAQGKHVHPNDACGSCHTDIVREWSESFHGQSWKDPLFQSAYRVEHLAFCRRCHAPESDPAREPLVLDAEVGVGCSSCHVQGQVMVSRERAKASPHETLVDERWQGAGACAGCHQFLFPSLSQQVIPIAMQNTAVEWGTSSAQVRDCASCHMKVISGSDGKPHRDHRFQVRDVAFMRNAAAATWRWVGDDVRFTISNRGAGHGFPTGDIFRRLVVRAYVVVDSGRQELFPETIALERRFQDVPVSSSSAGRSFLQRVQVADTRLGPMDTEGATRDFTLVVPAEKRSFAIHWQLVYQRMSPRLASYFGINLAEEELILAEDTIAPKDNSR